jgi:aspartate-semialdehyde dehydrogenase
MRVGLVGWRGMVGSVLMQRLREEGDLAGLEVVFFSTSQAGTRPPQGLGVDAPPVADANDLEALAGLEVIVTCQGGAWSEAVEPALRRRGWKGTWIDAASSFRMRDDAIIVLDPVNGPAIERALDLGVKTYVGGNCTVSLMLMALVGLFRQGWVEWVSTMTYQAASGAGASAMQDLVAQMAAIGAAAAPVLEDPGASALDLERVVTRALRSGKLQVAATGVPLAGSLIPWIDRPVEAGQTREEWKGLVETNKILGQDPPIPVDGICVRVGAMRCHSQAITVKLRRAVPLDEIESAISEAHEWVEVVPNTREATMERLTPAAVSGSLVVPVGRLHELRMGPEYLGAMTVGDQLLWGAAEPLRRVLRMVRDRAR